MMAVGMRPASLAGLVLIEARCSGLPLRYSVPSWWRLPTPWRPRARLQPRDGRDHDGRGRAMDALMFAQYAPDRMVLYAGVAMAMTILPGVAGLARDPNAAH